MLGKKFRLTKEGAGELRDGLSKLLKERGQIAERIKIAREFGDLTENAEYQSSRQEQDKNETRISEIEHILQNVAIIESPRSGGKVQLGSKVKLKGNTNKSREFQVVGTVEANPLSGKISY
jgi:transcription elongation factor GreA